MRWTSLLSFLCAACPGVNGTTPTGPCDVSEVVLNGADDDCDGWADEFGDGYRALTEDMRVLTGTEQLGLGEWLDVGVDATGRVWLAAGGDGAIISKGYGYPGFPGAVMARVQAGAEAVTIEDSMGATTDGTERFGRGVTVGAFEGTAVSLFANQGGVSLGFTGDETAPPEHAVEVPFTVLGGEDVDRDGFDELLVDDTDLVILDGPVVAPVWSTERARIAVAPTLVPGWTMAAGDLTGDGSIELVIPGVGGAGHQWIIDAGATGNLGLQDVLTSEVRGDVASPGSGGRAALGDANGDGYLDLLGGATHDDPPYEAYLLFGPFGSDRSVADAEAVFAGDFDGDLCGVTLTFTPDLDRDGSDEPIVTCGRETLGVDAPIRVELFLGADARGTVGLTSAAAVWVAQYTSRGGALVDGGFDLTGDAIPDLAIAAPGYSTPELPGAGAVYVVPGPLL